jgi:hypothetical protein
VAWQSQSVNDPDGWDVFGRSYDSAGLPLGGEFQVNTFGTLHQKDPAVASNAAGDFIVFWDSENASDSFREVFGQRYDTAFARTGGEFRASASRRQYAAYPAGAVDAAGNFLVAWQDFGQFSPGFEILGQRNKPDRLVHGSRLTVRAPLGTETSRSVSIQGGERLSDVGRTLDGDPTTAGATLRVIANGGTPSDQTFVLDASGWRAIASGYRYSGPTGGDGDPVGQVIIRLSESGRALIKARLRGRVGTQNLDVVPPNAGVDGGIILDIGTGGGRYCVGLDGVERRDTPQHWLLVNSNAEFCPS